MKILISFVIALTLSAPLSLRAQKIDYFYIEMPDALNPVLSKQQRAELLEYVKADMGDSIQNRFGKQTHVSKLDTLNNHILVRNTDISTFEMKLLEAGGDTIIAVIRTVCAPICRSSVNFYTTAWRKRSDIVFPFPKSVDWLDAAKINHDELPEENFRNMLTVDFVSLSFGDAGMQIRAKNHTLDYLEQEERDKIFPYIKQADFVYRRTNGEWTKTEDN